MENNTIKENLEINPETLKYLNTTRKWTMFLSILGFIGLGTFIIGGLIAAVFLSVFNTARTGLAEWMVITIIFVVGVIAFIPVLYLFRFSKNMAQTVKTSDQQALIKSFRNLKSYYVFTGVIVIVTIAIYVAAFIIAGASVSLFNLQ